MKPDDPGDVLILREDDPEHDRRIAQGWTVIAESWGARLRLADDADLSRYFAAVADAQDAGYELARLTGADASDIAALQARVGTDYPVTPATTPPQLPGDLSALLDREEWLAFGARDGEGRLAAFSTLTPEADRWEVERTAVAREHRRRGLAKGVKALSILTTYAGGARLWGTGGASVNAGSLAMNASLGFELEPRWHSLARPARPEGGRPEDPGRE